MQKIVIALVAIVALLVAVILLHARRPAPRPEGRGRLAARFALLVSGLMALLGGSRETRAEKPTPPAGDRDAREAALEKRTEWRRLRASFRAAAKLARVDLDALGKTVDAKRAECRKLLHPLVAAKLVSRDGAEVLTELHGDRIYHMLRARAATCYDMSNLDGKVQATREAREKQLALLASLAEKGTIKPEVAAKIRRSVQKQIELLLRVSALWQKQLHEKNPNWKAIHEEEDAILALFARREKHDDPEIKDEIKLRPGVEEAMRLCQLLLR